MSSLDRIKKKRQQLLVENNKSYSSTDKSMGRINLLRDELKTTGKIDYGDIAPSVLDNFSSSETDIAPVGSKSDLTTRRNELMEQIKNYDRKKNEDYWWDDDKGFLPNVGNVLSKLFVDSDSDNRYVKDEKYDALVKEYDELMQNGEYEPIKGLRKIGTAALVLTWQYFYPEKELPEGIRLRRERRFYR